MIFNNKNDLWDIKNESDEYERLYNLGKETNKANNKNIISENKEKDKDNTNNKKNKNIDTLEIFEKLQEIQERVIKLNIMNLV